MACEFPEGLLLLWQLLNTSNTTMKTLLMVPKLTSYISLYNEPLFSGQLYADADTKIYYILLISIVQILPCIKRKPD